ncbi:SPOR domain-containing protein [Segetibacter sp. 3557_3]|uniref:SPOR domain-containing protein n=1 Tax=Segetibacter sp. 3557_3 TaxID=2547429 RepID=UPI0014052560|nr:SPOR domain-containing protein [Segetibacter sp. 3557_3]
MRYFLWFLLAFGSLSLSAQKQQPSIFPDSGFGSVVVYKDPRLDVLSAKQAEINKRASLLSRSGKIRGYRIQVINTSKREEANTVKAEMLRRFPDEKTYLLYQAPHFRVRVGNFLKQRDAADLKKLITNLYPDKYIYVVPDLIEYTFTDDEDLDF